MSGRTSVAVTASNPRNDYAAMAAPASGTTRTVAESDSVNWTISE